MRILLTGASGAVGRETVKYLLTDKNNRVTVFDLENRKSRKILNRLKSEVKIVYGDIRNKGSLREACKDQDVVIHLAAIIPPVADDYPELANSINFLGTKNLIHCLEESSPGAFILYGSSVSVYGDRLEDQNIYVGDALNPSVGDEYAITKIKAEEEVKRSKFDYSIFRITAVIGANNHKMSKLIFHMPLATSIEIITPKDAGRAFAKAINQRDTLKSKIFNLGGGENCRITYSELLGRAFTTSGLGKLNFPKNTFADQNFHCGYYMDGDRLEDILHFRTESVEDFFDQYRAGLAPITRMLACLFRWPIKKFLLWQSEPRHAYKTSNRDLLNRFFKYSNAKGLV